MRLQILHMPDCPNTAVLLARLDGLAAQCRDFTVENQEVRDEHDAVRWGMTGSPTLLVDGVDPFAAGGRSPSLSCRLYVDEAGAVSGAPSVAQLSAVLARAAPADRLPSTEAWRAAGTGSRHGRLPAPLRVLHQQVLRHFLTDGMPPEWSWIEGKARQLALNPHAACGALAVADLVHLDPTGRVAVAYPFSGIDRGHLVRLSGGPAVWAMCAIDALGIPQLAHRDATISATDPVSSEPVRVDLRGSVWRWLPTSTAVLIARSGTGPSVDCTCEHVNFYADRDQAQAWLDTHPGLTGRVVDQSTAIDVAASVFGRLLDQGNYAERDS